MKNVTALFCAVCLLFFGSIPAAVIGADGNSGTAVGNVDGDNGITSTDARLILQLSVGKIQAGDVSHPEAADADGDGKITSTDARLILQLSVGKISAADLPANALAEHTFTFVKPNPLVTEGEMIDLALNVYQDLLDNWWTGDAKTGHFIPTFMGKPSESLHILWEHSMAALALDTLYQATGINDIHDRIVAEWNYVKEVTPNRDFFVRAAYGHNMWQDDAGWAAMFYMLAYKHTGDVFALDILGEQLHNCFEYWRDGDLAVNGLFYLPDFEPDTTNRHNALHAVSLLNAALDYLDLRDDPQLEKNVIDIYNWLEEHMLRDGEYSYITSSRQKKTGFCDDMLYWFNYNQQRAEFPEYTGPEGASSPNTIKEGQSTVFLGGEMGMAAVHAHLYKNTRDEKYLERAQRTLRAVNDNKYLVINGVYVDAGDAWTNASFMEPWVMEVMTLPGMQKKDAQILKDTADSIYNHARTEDGYYSGSWSGPADDRNTAWGRMGWTHDTIMCSATSIHMIFAAALAESMGL